MYDIVERLRECSSDEAHISREAADEIERLNEELNQQIQWVKDLADGLIKAEKEVSRLRAEVNLLTKDRDGCERRYQDKMRELIGSVEETVTLRTKNERLREALEDITGAGEEAWGLDRPCVKFARAELEKANEY